MPKPLDLSKYKRNEQLLDLWSIMHFSSGVVLGWLFSPWLAIAILVLYEPLELFVLSPLAAKFGILFGYESWKNSLADIVVDTTGVIIAVLLLK